LILKSTYVLILRDEKRAVWGSLYLDEHGEEDPNMRRGKTLFLNQNRYEELLRLWLNQSFDHDSKIIAATVSDGHYM
jgi:E3 ubiquitin-protein ligase UBR3